MSTLHIPIVHTRDVSKHPLRKNFPSGWKCYKTIGIYVCSLNLRSLESTQEARVALSYASSNSYASFMLSKLPACFDHISMNVHWHMNQLLTNKIISKLNTIVRLIRSLINLKSLYSSQVTHPARANPLTPKISSVILLTVCYTALMMLIWRILYWIIL